MKKKAFELFGPVFYYDLTTYTGVPSGDQKLMHDKLMEIDAQVEAKYEVILAKQIFGNKEESSAQLAKA